MPVGETNGKGWASDGNLLKVAGLIIAALIGTIWAIQMARQNTADQNLTTITHDVQEMKGDVGILSSKVDYQGHSIDTLGNRMSIVEQQALTTRDKADALEQRVNKQETNILEKKYQRKVKQDEIALERQQKHHNNEISAMTEAFKRQAVKVP